MPCLPPITSITLWTRSGFRLRLDFFPRPNLDQPGLHSAEAPPGVSERSEVSSVTWDIPLPEALLCRPRSRLTTIFGTVACTAYKHPPRCTHHPRSWALVEEPLVGASVPVAFCLAVSLSATLASSWWSIAEDSMSKAGAWPKRKERKGKKNLDSF